MIRVREAIVVAVRRSWPGAIELVVRLDGQAGRALAYPALVGSPLVGDTVYVSTAAADLELGTGGYHLVVATPGRLPDGPISGRSVKARYLPLQAMVTMVDDRDSPHRGAMEQVEDLEGLPVVIADLHSALPAICLAVLHDLPDARIAYVHTDGGALPMWLSETVAELVDADWLAATITVGQSFGGDLEAVTLHSGLLACVGVVDADVAVVCQGPGNLGTDSTWGFSGLAAGEAVNAVSILGGQPVASLRISDADPRARHRGISHHSRTAYGKVAHAQADVVVPAGLSGPLADAVDADLHDSGIRAKHSVFTVPVGDLDAVLSASPMRLRTMGRSYAEDKPYFLAAAAAGRHAADLARRRSSPGG